MVFDTFRIVGVTVTTIALVILLLRLVLLVILFTGISLSLVIIRILIVLVGVASLSLLLAVTHLTLPNLEFSSSNSSYPSSSLRIRVLEPIFLSPDLFRVINMYISD